MQMSYYMFQLILVQSQRERPPVLRHVEQAILRHLIRLAIGLQSTQATVQSIYELWKTIRPHLVDEDAYLDANWIGDSITRKFLINIYTYIPMITYHCKAHELKKTKQARIRDSVSMRVY